MKHEGKQKVNDWIKTEHLDPIKSWNVKHVM